MRGRLAAHDFFYLAPLLEIKVFSAQIGKFPFARIRIDAP
jgi:hypothetical protein